MVASFTRQEPVSSKLKTKKIPPSSRYWTWGVQLSHHTTIEKNEQRKCIVLVFFSSLNNRKIFENRQSKMTS